VIVSIASSKLQAQVATAGAELVRLQDEQGRDLLWDCDPAFWTGRSPLLFPIVGRVRSDHIRVDGVEYELRQHGFARTSQFEITETSPSRCRLRLGSDEDTLERYPFPFRLEVTYSIEEAALTVSALVTNAGERTLPASFGFHPAFRWPLPYGAPREAHEVRFERDEGAPIHRPVDGLLSRETYPSPVDDGRLELRDDLFADGAMIWDRLKSRAVQYGAPGRRSIRVAFPEMPHLGIWTKPGAGFVCIEPWQGYASPEDFTGEFADKPGIVLVPPGDTKTFEMEISVTMA
jgi:galactose mutarotase-like enzyme